MLQLRQLKTFLAAAETLSFTQAARRVHLAQPSVAEQIQSLEHSVGQALFVRKHNALALTPAGERLVVRARELLALADDTLRDVRADGEGDGGTLVVAAPQTLCATLLAPVGAQLAHALPGLQLVVQERNSSDTAQAVREGTADLGVVHGWPRDDAGLRVQLLTRDEPVVVMAPGHPFAREPAVALAALADAPLVVTGAGCRYRDYLDGLLQQAARQPLVRAQADDVASLLGMVAAGLGIAVLPRRSIDPRWAERLALRPLAPAGEGLPICLLTRAGQRVRPVSERFAGQLRLRASGEAVPALDVQHGAGGVAVAHEEEQGVGNVVRGADTAHRQARGHPGQ